MHIRTHNLKDLHNSAQSLGLTTSRLSCLADYGITSKERACLTSLLDFGTLIFTIAMSLLSVVKNKPLEVLDREVHETEVSVPLFLSTAGVATIITIIMCLVTFLQWKRLVVKDGQARNYDYSYAIDAMILAAKFSQDGEENMPNDDVIVGVSSCEPRVGPMTERMSGNIQFEEEGG
ncbi:hypothetical protein FGB62_47g144 [Gracilaria domingensis]|nr:hypothetical protein FGB62_47g144 [Gracilaria domingensis]